jgi:outer membrane protein TolC
MLVGVYDLLLAQQGQVQTARQYIASMKEFWQAWAEAERALGGKLAVPASASPSPTESDAAPTRTSTSMTEEHLHQHGDSQP